MGVLGAAVVGFVVGIALGILLDEALGLEGGLWDVVVVLIGLAGVREAQESWRVERFTGRHRHA